MGTVGVGLHAISAVSELDRERDAAEVRDGHKDVQILGYIRIGRVRLRWLPGGQQRLPLDLIQEVGVQHRDNGVVQVLAAQ
jgi:hypothetical protein